MNVTFNNCLFEGLGNPWMLSCPSNNSFLYLIGDEYDIEEPVLIVDDDVVCNIYCSANYDVICERGADEVISDSNNHYYEIYILSGLFVVIFSFFIFVLTFIIVKKKLNKRTSSSSPAYDPLN